MRREPETQVLSGRVNRWCPAALPRDLRRPLPKSTSSAGREERTAYIDLTRRGPHLLADCRPVFLTTYPTLTMFSPHPRRRRPEPHHHAVSASASGRARQLQRPSVVRRHGNWRLGPTFISGCCSTAMGLEPWLRPGFGRRCACARVRGQAHARESGPSRSAGGRRPCKHLRERAPQRGASLPPRQPASNIATSAGRAARERACPG